MASTDLWLARLQLTPRLIQFLGQQLFIGQHGLVFGGKHLVG